jgi:phosphotransferase system  glucose/maltose/N-acetylglucosamine-specific IIC component
MSDEPNKRGFMRNALSVLGAVAFLFFAILLGAAVTSNYVGAMIGYVIAVLMVCRRFSRD